jgi:hypothetical protein
MTAPTLYRSDDAGAVSAGLVINGTVGSLIPVLDAILVNGYTGKAAAGWTKPLSDTNKAAYYMGAGGTSDRMYLRVDDSAAQQARVVGYVTMSTIDAGDEPFPTEAQFSGGLYLNKSSAASATARPWVAIATPTTLYLFIEAGATVLGGAWQTSHGQLAFGEYATYAAGFTKNVMIISGPVTSISQGATFGRLQNANSSLAQLPGHFLARSYVDAAGAVWFTKNANQQFGTSDTARVIGIDCGPQVPSPLTGKVKMNRVRIMELQTQLVESGHLLGVWAPKAHTLLGNELDTIDGSGALAGKTFIRMDAAGANTGSTNANGQCCIDLTDFD